VLINIEGAIDALIFAAMAIKAYLLPCRELREARSGSLQQKARQQNLAGA
jgi:hypothetical protein